MGQAGGHERFVPRPRPAAMPRVRDGVALAPLRRLRCRPGRGRGRRDLGHRPRAPPVVAPSGGDDRAPPCRRPCSPCSPRRTAGTNPRSPEPGPPAGPAAWMGRRVGPTAPTTTPCGYGAGAGPRGLVDPARVGHGPPRGGRRRVRRRVVVAPRGARPGSAARGPHRGGGVRRRSVRPPGPHRHGRGARRRDRRPRHSGRPGGPHHRRPPRDRRPHLGQLGQLVVVAGGAGPHRRSGSRLRAVGRRPQPAVPRHRPGPGRPPDLGGPRSGDPARGGGDAGVAGGRRGGGPGRCGAGASVRRDLVDGSRAGLGPGRNRWDGLGLRRGSVDGRPGRLGAGSPRLCRLGGGGGLALAGPAGVGRLGGRRRHRCAARRYRSGRGRDGAGHGVVAGDGRGGGRGDRRRVAPRRRSVPGDPQRLLGGGGDRRPPSGRRGPVGPRGGGADVRRLATGGRRPGDRGSFVRARRGVGGRPGRHRRPRARHGRRRGAPQPASGHAAPDRSGQPGRPHRAGPGRHHPRSDHGRHAGGRRRPRRRSVGRGRAPAPPHRCGRCARPRRPVGHWH